MAEVAKRKGLHLIPDSHIGTAIIKASREYDCNPRDGGGTIHILHLR